jgi:glucokinase-like ROK family protein
VSTRTPLKLGTLRQVNRNVVFRLIRERGRTSRTELARLSGLSKATVSEIVADLLARGFVREAGMQSFGRGRNRVVLEFDPAARLVLGAQLDDTECAVVLADLNARPRHAATTPVRGGAPEDFVAALDEGVARLRPLAEAPILGLGLGAPGSIDPDGRRVTISVPLAWRDVPIADLVEARIGLPVLAANRAKVAALGEVWHGAGRGAEHLIYVFIGAGIVAGMVIHGALYFGSAGGAGELGHVTVLPDGPLCGCGNQGCLHTVASESAIIRSARVRARRTDGTLLRQLTDGLLGQIALEVLRDAAHQGDGVALATLAEAGAYLGLAIANLVNLVNPQLVVLGGPIAALGEPILEPIRREVRQRALPDSLVDLAIVPSTLGDAAGAIGAAALFLESLKDMEVLTGTAALVLGGGAGHWIAHDTAVAGP